MKLFTESLSRDDLTAICADMEIELYDYSDEGVRQRGKYAGKRCHKFTLKPVRYSDKFRKISGGYSYGRRNWAVSWAGFYVFMWAVFTLDAGAVFKTALAEWSGREDFAERAYHSGMRNVGSQMYPSQYRELQTDDHFLWLNETDLRAEGVRLIESKLSADDIEAARRNALVLN